MKASKSKYFYEVRSKKLKLLEPLRLKNLTLEAPRLSSKYQRHPLVVVENLVSSLSKLLALFIPL